MEADDVARHKKSLRRRPRIIFIDESGLTERPHGVGTWAPRGQTPVLFHHFNWKNLSLIAGLTIWDLYF